MRLDLMRVNTWKAIRYQWRLSDGASMEACFRHGIKKKVKDNCISHFFLF